MKGFSCAEALRCLDDLYGGVISDVDRAALEVHLAICDDCRARHAFWQRVRAITQVTPLRPLNVEEERRLLSGREPPPRRRATSLFGRLARYAAAITLFRYGTVAAVAVAGVTVAGVVVLDKVISEPPEPVRDPVVEVPLEPVTAAPEPVAGEPERIVESSEEEPVSAVAPLSVTPDVQQTILAPEIEPREESAELALVDRRPIGTSAEALPTAEEISLSARSHRLAQRYELACRDYQLLADTYPGTAAAGNSLIALGQLSLGPMERPEQAVHHFDAYLASYSAGDMAEDARVGRVRALAALSWDTLLVGACDEYLDHHAGGSARAEVLHFLGDAHRTLGHESEAICAYRTLLDEWPGTSHAEWAEIALDELGEPEDAP